MIQIFNQSLSRKKRKTQNPHRSCSALFELSVVWRACVAKFDLSALHERLSLWMFAVKLLGGTFSHCVHLSAPCRHYGTYCLFADFFPEHVKLFFDHFKQKKKKYFAFKYETHLESGVKENKTHVVVCYNSLPSNHTQQQWL